MHTQRLRHTNAQTDRQTDRHYLNPSGAKRQMSSGPSGPIFISINTIIFTKPIILYLIQYNCGQIFVEYSYISENE